MKLLILLAVGMLNKYALLNGQSCLSKHDIMTLQLLFY